MRLLAHIVPDSRTPRLAHSSFGCSESSIREALSSLQRLKGLEINWSSDLGGIANLSLLEQLSFSLDYGDSDLSMTGPITHLNDLQKFPALSSIVVIDEYDVQLQNICSQRNIVRRTKGDSEYHFPYFTSWQFIPQYCMGT